MRLTEKYAIVLLLYLMSCSVLAKRHRETSYSLPQDAMRARTETEDSDTTSDLTATDDDDEAYYPPDHDEEKCSVECFKYSMIITFPKSRLRGVDLEHLRLLDPSCKATENNTHFILNTSLTSCGTLSLHANHSVIYSNMVLPTAPTDHELVHHAPDFEIPFHCYYSDKGVVSSVGLSVASKKVIFSKKGFGEFTIKLDLYPDYSFDYPYTQSDFPVTKKLRERLFFQVSVHTKDKRLRLLAEDCFATPSSDTMGHPKYWFIKDGCKLDDTLEYYPSPNEAERFSIESFKFIGKYEFVFVHCHVKICNATDPDSRCARGCEHRRKRDAIRASDESLDNLYSLAQGPLTLDTDQNDESQQDESQVQEIRVKEGPNSLLVALLVVMSTVCIIGVSYMAWRKRKIVDDYTALADEVRN